MSLFRGRVRADVRTCSKTLGAWSKLKVRIKGSIENKSCSAIESDPKNVFEPNPTSKLAY